MKHQMIVEMVLFWLQDLALSGYPPKSLAIDAKERWEGRIWEGQLMQGSSVEFCCGIRNAACAFCVEENSCGKSQRYYSVD